MLVFQLQIDSSEERERKGRRQNFDLFEFLDQSRVDRPRHDAAEEALFAGVVFEAVPGVRSFSEQRGCADQGKVDGPHAQGLAGVAALVSQDLAGPRQAWPSGMAAALDVIETPAGHRDRPLHRRRESACSRSVSSAKSQPTTITCEVQVMQVPCHSGQRLSKLRRSVAKTSIVRQRRSSRPLPWMRNAGCPPSHRSQSLNASRYTGASNI